MSKFLALVRVLLLSVMLPVLALFAKDGVAAEQLPPQKAEQLRELLSDPEVAAWLTQQTQAATPAVSQDGTSTDATSWLSTVLAKIKENGRNVLQAYPRLPARFDRTVLILLVEFEEEGLFGIVVLILGFIAAGFGLDKLARLALRPYLRWMKTIATTNPRGRLRVLGVRIIYAFVMAAAFTIGSAGVFLAFDWPPLLREIVLAYLSVAIFTRIVLMISRVVLMPPFLGLPNSQQYRILPMADASASHWYSYAGINTTWFTFVGATLSLLATFGFDVAERTAIGIVAGFVQMILLMAAVWLRPAGTISQVHRFSKTTLSWLLTVFFVALWLLRVCGFYSVFWVMLAAALLPAAIAIVKQAVHHVLRPSEDGSETFPPVTIAVIERGIRVLLIVLVAYFLITGALDLDVFDVAMNDSLLERLLRGGLNAAIILLAADFGWSVAKALIARKLVEIMPVGHGTTANAQQARLFTLLPIFQNLLLAIIVVIAILMVLSSLGVEIAPLIAGAGVAGVAIGFGAQTLVKDVISGMFYLLDDAFRIGEYVQSGNYKGTVESFSLRSVKLRHHRGYLSTVPFGELGAVQNMSRDWVIDKFSVTVDYNTDIEKARKLIKKLGQELLENPEYAPHIIEPLKMQGVENFGAYGIELRLKMMTKPGEQFTIRRRAWFRLKQIFEANGILIPFPTVHVKGGGENADAAAAQLATALSPPPA